MSSSPSWSVSAVNYRCFTSPWSSSVHPSSIINIPEQSSSLIWCASERNDFGTISLVQHVLTESELSSEHHEINGTFYSTGSSWPPLNMERTKPGKFPTAPRHEVCSIWRTRTFMVPLMPGVIISGNGLLQYCQFLLKALNVSMRILYTCSRSHVLACVFQSWSGPEKLLALDELIDSCEPTQVKHMMQVIEPQFQRDFISLLPREVNITPKSLI